MLACGSLVAVAGVDSTVAGAAESDGAAAPALDDGLARWILRPRWWRQVPERPLAALSDVTHDSLTVSWTAPESAVFEIVDYDVQYRAAGDSRYVDWIHDGTATQATITGLAEITEYEVRVRAWTEVGEGEWSAPASGRTLLAPPRFVEGESADREVSENTPPGESIGVPVAAVVSEGALRYRLAGEDAEAFVIEASTGQLGTRQGVDYDHEARSSYAVEVEASHVAAGAARIAVRILVLDVDEPPGKPVPPVLSAFGFDGLRVAWDAPANTGPEIADYDVEYRERGTEEYLDAGHEGTATEATIRRLAPQTLYEVRVRAANDEGVGKWSDPAAGATRGSGGGGGNPLPPTRPPPSGSPDLVVESVSIDPPSVNRGEAFRLSARVRNRGDVAAAATVVRYYRSSNASISATDTQVGAGSAAALASNAVRDESIALTAPTSLGTYHYGACADPVAGESVAGNNCSAAAELTVRPPGPATAPAGQGAFDALFVGNYLSTPSYYIVFGSGGRFLEGGGNSGRYTYKNTGPNTGTLTQTYDDPTAFGGSCSTRLTFASAGAGTLRYTCAGGQDSTDQWRRDTVDNSSFNVEIVWRTSPSSAVADAFRAAAARWGSIIAESLGPVYYPGTGNLGFGVVDDLRIFVGVEPIDGRRGVAGHARAVLVRRSSGLPAVSVITLDADDVSSWSAGLLFGVVMHEMAHAVGFGSVSRFWGLVGGSSSDPHFTGAKATEAFDAAGGKNYAGEKVPMEPGGGGASHWRDSVFGNELMVASFSTNVIGMPLSPITVQALADAGYAVNVSAADGYRLPGSNTLRLLDSPATRIDGMPLKCVVTGPEPTDEVTLIELKSEAFP